MSPIRNSLIRRFGLALAAISLVALVNIGLSVAVAQSIAGSATAINVAGSLRKQIYQSLAYWHQVRSSAESADRVNSGEKRLAMLQAFDAQLGSSALVGSLPSSVDHPAARQYARVAAIWQTELRPMLTVAPLEMMPQVINQETQAFVDELDKLVALVEARTEARIQLMNVIQGVSLAFTLLILGLMLYDLRNNIVRPLHRLMEVTRTVSHRGLNQRSGLQGNDELSRLGQALDQMNDELAASYHGLESRVAEKTEELSRNQAVLQLLHSASRTLYGSGNLCDGAVPMLKQLEELLGIGPIKLYLHDRDALEPAQALTTAALQRPYYCKDHSCDACLIAPQAFDEVPSKERDGRRLLLPIRTATTLLGTLEVWYPKSRPFPDSSRHLLETLTDQLATAIFLQRQITEQQQLTLSEERTVIARELHDSLAQSLSYLKIQVSRLRKLDQAGPRHDLRAEILDELSTGLNSGYRQLRELLTTFRLKLDTPDLGTALLETVSEFSERLSNPVALHYQLPHQTLSPNEEIHILQIVREALSNSVKHSGATEVQVAVTFQSPEVRIRVVDNGCGLQQGNNPPQHYGQIIMQDRARTLGGQLTISNRDEGGVEVALAFVPKARHLIAAQASSSA